MKRINPNALIIFLFLITPYVLLFIVSTEKQKFYFEEDGVFESASAVYYFLSVIILIYLFLTSKLNKNSSSPAKHRNYFLLLLALFFFLCGGEEISWGQRIFNLRTPEFLKGINVQNEINIHNLKIFDVVDVDTQSNKKGLARMITPQRVYSLFWLLYCVLIPVLDRYISKVHKTLKKIKFPVVPIWIGLFFIFNFIVSKTMEVIGFFSNHYFLIHSGAEDYNYIFRLTENKEHGYAFLYLVLSISFYFIYNKQKPQTVSQ